MAYTYAQYVTTLANLMAQSETDPDFVQILPSIIDAAELRILRDLDLLSTRTFDASATVTANNRLFTLPSTAGPFVVVESINIFTPVGTTTTRNPLTPVSVDVLNWLWPSDTAASATTVPTMFAMATQAPIDAVSVNRVLLGPPPGAAFTAEVWGTFRPQSLSSTNTQTFLSVYMPDLLIASSMIFATGYQRDFGASTDNPAQGVSWSAEYTRLLGSAATEEATKKFEAASWSSKRVQPTAVPQRG